MKGMKKSMFISTVLMVVILIVALSTATFAWFASNDTAVVTESTMSAATAADANIAITWLAGGEGTSISFANETGLRPTIPKTIPVGNAVAGVLQNAQYISTTDIGTVVPVEDGVTYGETTATSFDIVQGYPATQEFVIVGSNDTNAPSAANDFQLTGLSHRDMIYKVSNAGFKTAATPTAFAALTQGKNWIPFTTLPAGSLPGGTTVNSINVIADGAGAVEGTSVEATPAAAYGITPAPTPGQVIYFASEVYAKVAQTTATVAGGETSNTPTSSPDISLDGGTTNYDFVVARSSGSVGVLLNSEVDIDDVQAAVASSGFGLTHALIGEKLYCVQSAKLAADNKTLTEAPDFFANFNAYSVLGGSYPRFNSIDNTAGPRQMAMAGWSSLSPEQKAIYSDVQPTNFYVINKNGSPTAPAITINVTATFTGLNASRLRVALFATTAEGGTPEYKGTLAAAASDTTYGIIATGVDSTTMPKYSADGTSISLGKLASSQSMKLACIVWYDGTQLTTTSAGLDAIFSLQFKTA